MKSALLLIALGFGYKVFADATKEAGGIKTLGRLIGIVMMVLSTAVIAVKTFQCAAAMYCPMNKTCAMSACPMMK